MRAYTLTHLSDATLLRSLSELVARDRTTTAALLAHIAEVDARRLYAPAGYPSMHAYCVEELHLSEDAAYKRIQAARVTRQFPALFAALADGRIHLAGACLLAPHLTAENVEAFVAAATHKRKSEIEQLLAQRFPRTELLAMEPSVLDSPLSDNRQLAPGQVAAMESANAAAPSTQHAPGHVAMSPPPDKLTPHAPGRFLLQLTIGASTHDKLRYAQELLSHAVPSGDVAQVIERSLDALIAHLEKRKFAATSMPRSATQQASASANANSRYVPAEVRHAVWTRDQGRCTFVGTNGHRCGARRRLEFDHIVPVAHGGAATVANLRLRCHAHNHYEAERMFGANVMREKRQQARADRAEDALALDLLAGLRELGVRGDEARRAIEYAQRNSEPMLEARMRAALKYIRPNVARSGVTARAS